ncbi:MAG: hypothetical protein WB697_11870 [Stellaceae bacterium]
MTDITTVVSIISAAGALGTASMGLVDASKVFWGGPSRFGFGYIKKAVEPFSPDVADGPTALRQEDIIETLRANWLNGVAAADQKAKARTLIHLRLTQGDATALASLTGVAADDLGSAAAKAKTGQTVSPQELAVIAQFDAVLSAVLDEAYERADQLYRNAAKALSVVVAVVLALIAEKYFINGVDWWQALLVGLIAAPLAPVSKDVVTALQNAVAAVRAVKA